MTFMPLWKLAATGKMNYRGRGLQSVRWDGFVQLQPGAIIETYIIPNSTIIALENFKKIPTK